MGRTRVAALLLCFLALTSAFASVCASEEAEVQETPEVVEPEVVEPEVEAVQSDVLVLDFKNFTDTVEKYDFIVVEFYAPWCGHCKRLAPEYDAAATVLKSHDPPIILAKIDANEDENKAVAEEFDVKGFPTLVIIRNKGEVVSSYDGPRDADGIVSYLKKLTGPPSIELTSADQAKEFLTENEKELVIVGVFEAIDGEEYTNFIKVADEKRGDYLFAHTLDVSYLPDNGVPLKTPSIRLYKSFDEKTADSKDFSPEALTKFIEVESLQLVTEMSKKPEHRPALMKFFGSPKSKVFLFIAGTQEDEESAALLSSFTKDAKSFKEKELIFLFSEEGESANALQFFGLSSADLPSYVVQNAGGKKYITKNVVAEQLAPWLEEFLGGNLKEHIKSAAIPETNDEPVKVIVADSLKAEVLDAGKDTLLEFYAPWCGHCKKLAPILDEVAVSIKESDPDVVIAKFDATTNDVDSTLFDVKGFPTLYFYSASGVITSYEGDNTKEGIIEFINEQKSNKSVKLEESVTEEEPVKEEPVKLEEPEPVKLEEPVETSSMKDEL